MIWKFIFAGLGILLTWRIMDWDIKSDYEKIKNDLGINHNNEFWVRILLLIVPCIAFSFGLIFKTYSVLYMLVISSIVSIGFVAFYYWMFFDGRLNNKRRYDWWFPGSPGPEDGKFEKFLHRLTKWQIIGIKIGGCLLFTILYIILWK